MPPMESLRGQLLIASPKIVDANFRRVVVYMAEHNDDGAMGLVLNRPAETTVSEAVPDLEWLAGDGDARGWGRGPGGGAAGVGAARGGGPSGAAAVLEGGLRVLPAAVGGPPAV